MPPIKLFFTAAIVVLTAGIVSAGDLEKDFVTPPDATEPRGFGVDIGWFDSPGWSQPSGPWVKPSQAMRYVTCWSCVSVVQIQLPKPYNCALDVFSE